MAHIRRRKLKNGKTAFQVRWINPDGVEDSKQFPPGQSDAAKRFKVEIEQRTIDGTYVDHNAGRIRLRDYANQWLANQITRDSTVRVHEGRLRHDVYPILGDRQVNAIRRSDVLALFKGLTLRLSPNTVHGTHTALSAVYNAAVLDRLIATSPVTRIPLPAVVKPDIVIPTVEQVESIAGVTPLVVDGESLPGVPARMRAYVLTAAMTGLRIGELFGMTLESVDLLRAEVTIRPDLGQLLRKSGELVLGPPKSAASARTVPLSPRAVDVLAAHLAEWPTSRDDGYGGLVFQAVRYPGRPMDDSYVSFHLAPVMKAHGFPPRTATHVFRHFYASTLIAAGVDLKTIQTLLGHASITETMDTYGHLVPESSQVARDAIDEAFAKRKTPRSGGGAQSG